MKNIKNKIKNKTKKERTPVKCLVCGYEWVYTKGIPKYRIRCPNCASARNDLNREVFGYWHPEGEKK